MLREQVQIGLVRDLPHPAVVQRPRSTRTRSCSSSSPGHRFRRAGFDRRRRAGRGAPDPVRPHLELLRPHERVLPRGRSRSPRRDGARQRRRDEEDGRARPRDRVSPVHGCARASSRPGRSASSRSRATSRCGGRSSRCAAVTPSCRRISSMACLRPWFATSSSASSARRPAESITTGAPVNARPPGPSRNAAVSATSSGSSSRFTACGASSTSSRTRSGGTPVACDCASICDSTIGVRT